MPGWYAPLPIPLSCLHDDVIPSPAILPPPRTTFDACLDLVGPGGDDSAAWASLWRKRLREFGVPVGPDVDADRWTERLLSCVRFYGVEV